MYHKEHPNHQPKPTAKLSLIPSIGFIICFLQKIFRTPELLQQSPKDSCETCDGTSLSLRKKRGLARNLGEHLGSKKHPINISSNRPFFLGVVKNSKGFSGPNPEVPLTCLKTFGKGIWQNSSMADRQKLEFRV